MANWGPISFDFYSFGSLVGVIFTFYNAQLFLTVKEKSRATYLLGMGTLSLGFFHLAYMINFSFLGPAAAYMRWLVIPSALIGAAYLASFFLSYPEDTYPRFRKYLFISMMAVVAVFTVSFAYISLGAGRTYFFSGHYWDFPLAKFYKLYSLAVLVYFAIFAIVGIVQIIKTTKELRFVLAIILFSFLLITIVPGILNAQSRDGAIERGLFQTITDLLLVVGLFIAIVVYINNTKDKTTILSRIIGISLATFLLVIQLVAYVSIQQTEVSFDRIYFQQARSAVIDEDSRKKVSFFFTYDLNSREGKSLKDPENTTLSPKEYVPEFWNSWLYEEIISISDGESLRDRLDPILAKMPADSKGYVSEIKSAVDTGGVNTSSGLVTYLNSLKRKILYTRNKWKEISPNEVKTKGKALFSLQSGPMSSFHSTAVSIIDSSLPEETIWNKVNILLSPMTYTGERNYRGKILFAENAPDFHFFISYFIVDKKENKVYEIGFPYLDYRDFQHQSSLPWMYGVVAIAAIVILGFRLFFLRALIRPIEQIIEGLTEVNSGNLEHRLVINVEDDIGFMARSFNRMVRSIQAARKKLQQYAEQLESKVQERTKELENTLKEVQALKHQQDGDYFLTSLLLQPFSANHADHDNVQVDFLLEQKKKFTFRQHSKEIGGDLNIANQIFLNGKSYTVFLNADAMGKSMQGAGGALVLGSVFESIITRTQLSNEARRTYPERWIKNTFIELHKVFEGFDGSMLVSLVLGLIDNESGLLYFINAEHPWIVLYRDGIASFMENELMFRKLGTSGVAGDIYIRTFQLEPGDVVIAGSDGRDDLLISHTAEGKRVINEDERLFLKVVERGQGDLEKIYDELQKIGSLTDDLSLLRVSFVEEREKARIEKEKLKEIQSLLGKAKQASDSQDLQEAVAYLEEANSLEANIPEIKKKFIQLYLKLKDYGKAKSLARDYSELKPMDTEIMYVTAFCARKVADLKTAVDFGERVRLRDPQHVKNLINLGQTYLAEKNYVRAEIILTAAVVLDPENPSLARLLDHIRKKQSKNEPVA
ncbi:SpoIIE family protein phosphatase [Leptospira ilyithenensis]|uniref:HAMP domain-containing protein n=1 Tax=Leptospira ilyithenensis TaxID=2484901 RepID=A0A4R9LLE1_9LEPT|nr:SpoIIE family protein phosphatase [Leptospira ilyithenensis]TGN08435.1 HAMP domain-containing protein [Leptospira ilyithenensis]